MRTVIPGELTLADLRAVWSGDPVGIADGAWPAVDAAAAAIDHIVGLGAPAYGVNTGFGKLANRQIPDHQLRALQANLIRSHAVGVGPRVDDRVVRIILATKALSLARGVSGVRRAVIESILALLNHDVLPLIPSQGSVGASGDLAPLSHLALVLVGEGEVTCGGEVQPSAQALAAIGLAPLTLGPKEGLALINGTQVSAALALHALFLTEAVFSAAVTTGALAVDAARGSDAPFDARVHAVRGQPGQSDVAALYRELLTDSEIRRSHLIHDERVQDPYSLRCQPQVMGACLDLIRNVTRTLLIEANAVTDNPLLFAEPDGTWVVLSGGNFHAEPVALAADTLALAIAEIGALAERRIALLIDANLSGLPPFLVADAGLHSGFMIAHVTAAALASENKSLAHPASVDSLPTSANQEDHVSMATFAARRLGDMVRNTATIVGIELLAAAQGVDFHRPLRSSAPLEDVVALVRSHIPFYDADRYLAPELAWARDLVLSGELGAARPVLPSWST